MCVRACVCACVCACANLGDFSGFRCQQLYYAVVFSLVLTIVTTVVLFSATTFRWVLESERMRRLCPVKGHVVADEIGNNLFGSRLRFLDVMERVLNYSASLACTHSFCSHRSVGGCRAVCTHPSDYSRFHLPQLYFKYMCVLSWISSRGLLSVCPLTMHTYWIPAVAGLCWSALFYSCCSVSMLDIRILAVTTWVEHWPGVWYVIAMCIYSCVPHALHLAGFLTFFLSSVFVFFLLWMCLHLRIGTSLLTVVLVDLVWFWILALWDRVHIFGSWGCQIIS